MISFLRRKIILLTIEHREANADLHHKRAQEYYKSTKKELLIGEEKRFGCSYFFARYKHNLVNKN